MAKEVDLSELAPHIEALLRKYGHVTSNQLVHRVDIVVGNKPETIIKVGHQDGQHFLAKAPKMPKPKAGGTTASDRRLGLRRLRLIPGLKAQTVNALENEGITTVAAVRKMSLAEVLLIRNISESRARGIKDALAGIGELLDWDI